MKRIVTNYCALPWLLKRPLWRIWHRLIIRFDKEGRAVFLNYGFDEHDGSERLYLTDEDKGNRYCIQLYRHVAGGIPLRSKDIVEVGSGRGGGASFLTRYYGPRTYRAIDISSRLVEFCSRYHDIEGLTFQKGDAGDLPVESKSCDVVINVESARCYRDIGRFFTEVGRILRPGGFFLFADMMPPGQLPGILTDLHSRGFRILSQQDITRNVVMALEKDSSRREAIINRRAPRFLTRAFSQFAGIRGTERYEAFHNGKFQYWSFILERPA